jgi:hypothetical protein
MSLQRLAEDGPLSECTMLLVGGKAATFAGGGPRSELRVDGVEWFATAAECAEPTW